MKAKSYLYVIKKTNDIFTKYNISYFKFKATIKVTKALLVLLIALTILNKIIIT